MARWLRWPTSFPQDVLAYGADYNPEQWPRAVWREDMHAMREAGVNLVSVGIFSWARLQPSAQEWTFGWLDEVLDLLYDNGIAVSLGTATASPPPWLALEHPEILPVNREGATLWPGGRQHWRPTSPVFREHALRLVRTLAHRYASHPALAMWHVSNELGCHNAYDYSDDAARAFRDWLRQRFGTLDALNEAWGTSFWSQHYSDWAQILPPRLAASYPNPTQQLDFRRFCSDALLDYLRAETAVLREITPTIPVTTNFMVMGGSQSLDYASWAADVDFIANDHYVWPGPQAHDELSFSANLAANLGGGKPWLLLEHSTSAVNWQPVNVAKRPGELARDSLTHVAHGADGVCFFQWRASKAGAEKYHSAMLPHAGTDSALFRDVVSLGEVLSRLAPVTGSHRSKATVALLHDWPSWWAAEAEAHPSSLIRYRAEAVNWYTALLSLGIRADVLPAEAAVDGYAVVIAPMLHIMGETLAERLRSYVDGGGHLVTTYFSGIVDDNDHIWLGGYPGALRELLGIRVEEFAPLPAGESVELSNGSTGTQWTEQIQLTDPATVTIASYPSGSPAVTRRRVDRGSASYVSTHLEPAGLLPVARDLLNAAGVQSELPPAARGAVELVIRQSPAAEYWFLINRTGETVDVSQVDGTVLHGTRIDTTVRLDPHAVAVIEKRHEPSQLP